MVTHQTTRSELFSLTYVKWWPSNHQNLTLPSSSICSVIADSSLHHPPSKLHLILALLSKSFIVLINAFATSPYLPIFPRVLDPEISCVLVLRSWCEYIEFERTAVRIKPSFYQLNERAKTRRFEAKDFFFNGVTFRFWIFGCIFESS